MKKEFEEHILSCKECREFYKEMFTEILEAQKTSFTQIVSEQFQCSLTTLTRVEKLENKTNWLLAGLLVEGLGIISIILYISAK